MELKDIQDTASGAVNAAVGAVVNATEAAANPGRTIERELGRLERKGAPVRRQAHARVTRTAHEIEDTAGDIAASFLPERIVLHGLALVKARARRVDLIGEMAYRGLDLVHGSLKDFTSALDRLERASQPPARPGRSVSRAAKTSAVQTRTAAKRTTRTATATARKTTTRARRTTRRTARRATA